jgi:hypothetical protein
LTWTGSIVSPAKWLLLTFGTGAIVAYAVWWYRTREEPVRGWVWAAVLRAAALTAAWVILLNPLLPMGIGGDGRGAEAVLLDASLSMTRRSEGGRSGWSTALDSVRAYERVWLFGDPVPRFVTTDSLPTEPEYDQTLLAPALRAAAASGVRRALVYTDGVIGDVREAREEARRQGIALSVVDLGHTYAEHGIANLEASSWALAGDSAEVRIEVVAAGMAGDSIPVEILDENGRVVSSARLPGPATGMFTPARLGFAVRGGPGLRRYIVRLASDTPDPEPRDDRRVFYVRVTERPAGPVLLSLRPDWEPSFLIPNLDRLTDAPTSAFLLLADSLVDLDGYRAVSRFAVQRRAEAAPLLVLHGYGADAPEWVQSLANAASSFWVSESGSVRPLRASGTPPPSRHARRLLLISPAFRWTSCRHYWTCVPSRPTARGRRSRSSDSEGASRHLRCWRGARARAAGQSLRRRATGAGPSDRAPDVSSTGRYGPV